MKYMVSGEENCFFENFEDAAKTALIMANEMVGTRTTVCVQDIYSNEIVLRLYLGGGEICPYFNTFTPGLFSGCNIQQDYGLYYGPISYLEERYGVKRQFPSKFIATKDSKVVAICSSLHELEDELEIGCIDLPVQIMHICMDGTVENYEYKGDKE